MSRAQRLLDLIQLLRQHRRPVSGAVLADVLGISLRSLYRDIATLIAQGAHIEGEAGVGYVLRPGFMLPPMMFSEDEIEALVLGSRWVAERGDDALAKAAASALTRIAAVLPADLKAGIEDSGLLVGPAQDIGVGDQELAAIRLAIRTGTKLRLDYRDRDGGATRRVVWPFALGFFERARMLAAWCELRDGYRHFRIDRVTGLKRLDKRYPRRRQVLLKEWRALEGIPQP